MRLRRSLFFLFVAFMVASCARFQEEPLEWSIGTVVPEHYNAWVKPLQIETTGIRAWRVPQGRVSCCWKQPRNTISESITPPPNFVLVRWFAFAERKFYGRLVELPADLEERMRRKTPSPSGDHKEPQDTLIFGLAPGGQIVIWLMNYAQNAEEILRVQAFEQEGDLSHFEVRLENYDAEHGDYIKQHGIQYDGW